jgi:hypothetical protein
VKGVSKYIDPNTGGVLFQALAGVLGVISALLLGFSRNIRQWFSRLRRNARNEEDGEE